MTVRPPQRRTVAALLLLAYAVVATGLPLPVPQPKPWSAERFPCENCGCGCSSAEVCWTECCCQSLKERLAWAERENIRPHDVALSEALVKGYDVSRWVSKEDTPVLIALAPKPKKKACCCCKPKAQADDAEEEADGLARVWRKLTCHGVLQLWLSIAEALPASPKQGLGDAPLTYAAGAVVIPIRSCVTTPPTPPPERLS